MATITIEISVELAPFVADVINRAADDEEGIHRLTDDMNLEGDEEAALEAQLTTDLRGVAALIDDRLGEIRESPLE